MDLLKKYQNIFEITSDGIGMIDFYLDEQRADLGDESLQWWEKVRSDSLIISLDEKKAVEIYADEKYNIINQICFQARFRMIGIKMILT